MLIMGGWCEFSLQSSFLSVEVGFYDFYARSFLTSGLDDDDDDDDYVIALKLQLYERRCKNSKP